jgi:hypothetical protein
MLVKNKLYLNKSESRTSENNTYFPRCSNCNHFGTLHQINNEGEYACTYIVSVSDGGTTKKTCDCERMVLVCDYKSAARLDSQNKELVTLAIESILLKTGLPLYEIVVEKLYSQYTCKLADCYEHPQYLSIILKDLYGEKAYSAIVKSIWDELQNYVQYESVTQFLQVLSSNLE